MKNTIEKVNLDKFIEDAKKLYSKELKKSGMSETQAETACKIWGKNEYTIDQFKNKEEYDNVMFWVNDVRERTLSNYLKHINAGDNYSFGDLARAYFITHSVDGFYKFNITDDTILDLVYYDNSKYGERGYYFVQIWPEEDEKFIFKVDARPKELRIYQITDDKQEELFNDIIDIYTISENEAKK